LLVFFYYLDYKRAGEKEIKVKQHMTHKMQEERVLWINKHTHTQHSKHMKSNFY